MKRKLMLLDLQEQALVRMWRGLCDTGEYDEAKDVREFVLFQSVGRREGAAVDQKVRMATGGESWSGKEAEQRSQRVLAEAISSFAAELLEKHTGAPHGRLSEDEVADLLAKAN